MSEPTAARQERDVRWTPIDSLNVQYGEAELTRELVVSGHRIAIGNGEISLVAVLPNGYRICRASQIPE